MFLENLDLISVGIVIAGTVILGISVYFNKSDSQSNRAFLYFSIITAVWGVTNYLAYQFIDEQLILWAFRIVLFLATWQAFAIFHFFYVFPSDKKRLPIFYKYLLLPLVGLTSVLALTPFVFSGVAEVIKNGASKTIVESGIFLFGIVAIGLVISGMVIISKKLINARAKEKTSIRLILIGALLMFALIITFNFIVAGIFLNVTYIPLGALFVFPFIAFTSYAILRHRLFNVRAMWAGVLVFLLAIVAFFEVIFARDLTLIIYRGGVFLLILIFGILLIKGIIREVRQREEIQELAGRLKSVNSILAHDVKATLGKNKDMFITLLDGTFGSIADKAKSLLERSFTDTRKMIETITNILAAGRDMTLTVESFNLKEMVLEVIKDVGKDAEAKHLTITSDITDGDYTITADKTQLTTHVLKNLIENAINYNLENGSVTIGLSRKGAAMFLFTVKDTGVGIKEEDKPNMFKEGGRGKESTKVNVHSSGYGLVTAKKTAEAHGGKIWFESEGISGKGTTFFVELPSVAKTSNPPTEAK